MKAQNEQAAARQRMPYPARAFSPVHADLANAAGVPEQLANEAYVEALARIIYYRKAP